MYVFSSLLLLLLLFFLRALKKKTKPLNLKIHSNVGSCENLPTQRSPLHTERSLRSFFFPSFIPSTPPVHAETPSASKEPPFPVFLHWCLPVVTNPVTPFNHCGSSRGATLSNQHTLPPLSNTDTQLGCKVQQAGANQTAA